MDCIWTVENPPSDTHKAYLWGSCEHFGIFTKALRRTPFRKEWLKNEPGKNCRACEAAQEPEPEVNRDGHFIRHIGTHLPTGIGFFTYCPACGEKYRRGCSFRRHAEGCAKRNHIRANRLKEDGMRNVFLR
jgi:hypothetical protein